MEEHLKKLLFDACKQELHNMECHCAEMHRDVHAATRMPHRLIATPFLRSALLCLMHEFRNEEDPVAAIRNMLVEDINKLLANGGIETTITELNKLYKEMETNE